MSQPTQLTFTLVDDSTVTINIPASLQALDSGQTSDSQSGYRASDALIRSIFRAGVFTDGVGVWYACTQIKQIVAA
jgi:hypothetical protein